MHPNVYDPRVRLWRKMKWGVSSVLKNVGAEASNLIAEVEGKEIKNVLEQIKRVRIQYFSIYL